MGASAVMAATKNSIREAVDGSQQYDVLLKDKNRRILQLEDDVAMLQGKLKHALSGAALAEAEQLVAQRASELSLVKDKARAVISEITQQKAALEARVRDYQRQRRLTVDGLVGYQTQITINTDLGRDQTPKLARMN